MKRAETPSHGEEEMIPLILKRPRSIIFLLSLPFFFGVLVATPATATKPKQNEVKTRYQVGTCLIEKALCNIQEDLDPWQKQCDFESKIQIEKIGKVSYKTQCAPLRRNDSIVNEVDEALKTTHSCVPFITKIEADVNYIVIDCTLNKLTPE